MKFDRKILHKLYIIANSIVASYLGLYCFNKLKYRQVWNNNVFKYRGIELKSPADCNKEEIEILFKKCIDIHIDEKSFYDLEGTIDYLHKKQEERKKKFLRETKKMFYRKNITTEDVMDYIKKIYSRDTFLDNQSEELKKYTVMFKEEYRLRKMINHCSKDANKCIYTEEWIDNNLRTIKLRKEYCDNHNELETVVFKSTYDPRDKIK